MDTRRKLLVIGGPTASGKSAVAVQAAKRLNGEIVGADSMQIYKRLSIGTAKPTAAELDGVPHHMIDCIDPAYRYGVAEYKAQAMACIEGIFDRGRLPIVCGGTGLYIASLLYDMDFAAAPPDAARRAELADYLAAHGADALHKRLQAADPTAAQRIHANDTKRVMRALEAAGQGGSVDRDFRKKPGAYDAVFTALRMERMALYRRIDARVDAMMRQGLLDEVQALLKEGLPPDATALSYIGYKELVAHLNGDLTLPDAVDAIKRNTRRYAKRQMTWLARERCVWLDADDRPAAALAERIADLYAGRIAGD